MANVFDDDLELFGWDRHPGCPARSERGGGDQHRRRGLDDLLGLAVLGREKVTRQWLLWSRAWAHASVLERRKGEASVLRDFETAGELRIVDKLGDDIAEIAALARRVDDTGLLHAVGLDPFGVGAIVDALAEVGIAGNDRVIGITQGWKLTGAIKTAERKLADGTLSHGGQRMILVRRQRQRSSRGNAIVITKQAAGSAKRRSADGRLQRRQPDDPEPACRQGLCGVGFSGLVESMSARFS